MSNEDDLPDFGDAPDEILSTLPAARDLGHAMVLAELHRNLYRWAEHRGTWMRWTGRVWAAVTEERMVMASTDTLRCYYAEQLKLAGGDKNEIKRITALVNETCIYTRMIGALSFLKGMAGYCTASDEWDSDPWLLNVQNGELDLRTGELRQHNPLHLHSLIAGVEYLEGSTSEGWDAHLARFLPEENVRRQVQRDLGVALVASTLQERLPIWYGTGGNGKTTTGRIMQAVFGRYAKAAAPNLLIQSKYERHPTEIADLMGSRIVFSVEIGGGRKLDEAQVKSLTGGDTKKARYMRQDFFEFEQTFSIMLLVNHRPRISDADEGIWRRVALIPWIVKIDEAERKPQDEIVSALVGPWILSWLLAGLQDWQRNPTWVAPEVIAATAAYRQEEDRFSGFLGERCDLAPRFWTPTADLFAAYEAWCKDADEQPAGMRAFTLRLAEAGCDPKAGAHKVRGWRGIRVKTAFKSLAGNDIGGNGGAVGGTCTIIAPASNFSLGDMEAVPPSAPDATQEDLWEGSDLDDPGSAEVTSEDLPEANG